MNKITKLLFAFVAVASFSLTSCEPDYVTDGSTVPSEAHITISYLDSEGNVTSTKEYIFDKTNSLVAGTRGPKQDTEGVSYTESRISAEPIPTMREEMASLYLFLDFQEPGVYGITDTGRNTAEISIPKNGLFESTEGYIEIFNYDILTGSTVSDMYFRSRAKFSFYGVKVTGEKCRVDGTITTNLKL